MEIYPVPRSSGYILDGEVHSYANVDAPPPNACVFPTEAELGVVVDYLQSRQLQLVSVGCGQGFLEGLLEERGVMVWSVDLQPSELTKSSVLKQKVYCSAIHRVSPNVVFDLKFPSTKALMFCFGRRCPLASYLLCYPECFSVLIISDLEGVASPSAYDLRECDGWRIVKELKMLAVTKPTLCVFYERVHTKSSIA